MRVLLLLLFLLPVPLFGQNRPTLYDTPLSERRVRYVMNVRLDVDARTVTGTEQLTWRNPDRVPVDELQFHLYLNAFKNEKSTFMRESGGQLRGISARGPDRWGWIDLHAFQIAEGPAAGTNLLPHVRYIQPDDGNTDDQTVIAVTLPQPVPPGETITLDIQFTSRLPRVFARTGWAEKPDGKLFFMIAQWFPKIGVYEIPGQRYVPPDAPRGRWNTHQFHANSEFYADFGVYDVTMTVPPDYIVGATGIRTDSIATDTSLTVRYYAEDVHDFAWTASNDYLVYTDQWNHVRLRLLLQPEHRAQAQRHFKAAKTGLQYFNERIGEYPYTTLTLVDGIGGANGMEYPTLITCGTTYGLPEWLRALEVVTIHEFGHQYWYGMVANNEFEEPWLDEGINSFTEMHILDETYGPALDLRHWPVYDSQFQRLSYTKNAPDRGKIFAAAWEHPFGDYGKVTYAKTATMLATLEGLVGTDTMWQILKTYYERWRFKHPTSRDFIAIAEEVSGKDLNWFFDQFLYDSKAVDYEVNRIVNRPLPRFYRGIFDRDSIRILVGDDGNVYLYPETDSMLYELPDSIRKQPRTYQTEIWLHRREAAVIPQPLRITFADGSTLDTLWDGQDTWKKLVLPPRKERVIEAFLDPENTIPLDINRLNNRLSLEGDNTFARKYQLRFWVRLQQLLFTLAGLL